MSAGRPAPAADRRWRRAPARALANVAANVAANVTATALTIA